MELSLIALMLFTGLIPLIQSVPRKFYLIQQDKTWSDAQAYCRAEHTDLATVETNDDLTKLQDEAQRHQFSSSAWIGLHRDLTGWRWSLGNEPLGMERWWAPTQPDNAGGHEECAAIDSWGWIDATCTLHLSSFCFDERIGGPDSYIKISDPKTWPDAQSYCREHYTDLASARDTTENTVIKGLVSEWTWIGLFRDSWKWSDQTRFSTVSWMSVNTLGSNDCVHVSAGQAADAPCSDAKPFFCYSEISGRKQVIRLTVRSNQYVNDPEVKAAIFEHIKRNLKDHGMAENITVKWRKQPDRAVFHK